MPDIVEKAYGYHIYFWSNEGEPLEPIHFFTFLVYRIKMQLNIGYCEMVHLSKRTTMIIFRRMIFRE